MLHSFSEYSVHNGPFNPFYSSLVAQFSSWIQYQYLLGDRVGASQLLRWTGQRLLLFTLYTIQHAQRAKACNRSDGERTVEMGRQFQQIPLVVIKSTRVGYLEEAF